MVDLRLIFVRMFSDQEKERVRDYFELMKKNISASYYCIDTEEVIAIGEALKVNQTLTTLM